MSLSPFVPLALIIPFTPLSLGLDPHSRASGTNGGTAVIIRINEPERSGAASDSAAGSKQSQTLIISLLCVSPTLESSVGKRVFSFLLLFSYSTFSSVFASHDFFLTD